MITIKATLSKHFHKKSNNICRVHQGVHRRDHPQVVEYVQCLDLDRVQDLHQGPDLDHDLLHVENRDP